MWYEWIIFAVVFLLFPIAVVNFKIMEEKRINPTEEQKKKANLNCGFFILFYWLCDLFYMAVILDSLALKFVFGGLIMLIIFYNLSKAFISGASHFKWGLIQDFLVGVGMSIYLIYIIPSADLKEVVIPIVSAVYGGLITLVGVAWTIKKTDNDRKEDERKKAKPLFTFSRKADDNDNIMEKKACFETAIDTRTFIVCADIENSDHAPFVITRIFTDGEWRAIEGDTVVLPNKTVILQFYFENDINNLFMEVKDALNNCYYYEMKVVCVKLFAPLTPSPKLHTIREIKEVSLDEIEKRTNNAEGSK